MLDAAFYSDKQTKLTSKESTLDLMHAYRKLAQQQQQQKTNLGITTFLFFDI
jgi:hypothetical protein